MPNPPEYRANEGTPEQLPRGAATELNDAAVQTREEQAAPIEAAPNEPVQYAAPVEPVQTADKDELDFLTSPPEPQDVERYGTARTAPANAPLPDDVRAALPLLTEASRDPSAPPQLITLVKLLADQAG